MRIGEKKWIIILLLELLSAGVIASLVVGIFSLIVAVKNTST